MGSPWSPHFLQATLQLIHSSADPRVDVHVDDHQQDILPKIPHDILMTTWKQIFGHPSRRMKLPFNPLSSDGGFGGLRPPNLTENQWRIMERCDHLIETLDDFHYLMGQVPFYVPLMDLLLGIMRSQPGSWVLETFIAPPIQSWIYQKCRVSDRFQFHLPDQTVINVQIIHVVGFSEFVPILKSIARVVTMICRVHRLPPSRPLNLTYIMTPFRKKIYWYRPNPIINAELAQTESLYNLTQMTNPITPLSVNSGLTSLGARPYIIIWREEEFEKVLIHELIHYYDLEKGCEFTSPFVNISNNYPHYPKELFTELQTWYLYIVYRLSQRFACCASSSTLSSFLDRERFHSWLNLCRLLQHYQITDWEQLITKDPDHRINMGSSALYYYLFKAMLLASNDPLTEWLMYPQPTLGDRHEVAQRTADKLRGYFHNPMLITPITVSLRDDNSLRMMWGDEVPHDPPLRKGLKWNSGISPGLPFQWFRHSEQL